MINRATSQAIRHISKSIGFCCFLSTLSCSDPELKTFTRLAGDETGIDFVNENVETERSNILTYEYFYNGGGVALGDINNDGRLDIYFSSTIFENKLYLNKGNFKFEDITASSGTSCSVGWKTGVTMVDINADGFLDIYVCRSASPDPERRKNILLVNNKNNTFTDRADEYGLDDQSYSTQAAFFDFDHDNDLDAVILNHSILDISNSFSINLRNADTRYPHVGNRFLKNENGRFIDVSDSVGVYGPASNYGLGISLSDVNNDGWIDIYAGCDYTGRDRLLINRNGEFFDDMTHESLSHISKFTMGTDIADFNGDGLMDIFTVDMLPEGNARQKQLFGADRYDTYSGMVRNGLHHQYMRNMLHMNLGNGAFSEVGQLAGVANTDWSWSALFADYDNDGLQDLFVTNGFKRDLTDNDFAKYKAFEEIQTTRRQGKNPSYLAVIDKFRENKIPNYIFRGSDSLQFSNVTDSWGFGEPTLTNGAAYGDLDNDGDLDLVTNNINDPAGVYRNNTNALTHENFLTLELSGKGANRHAVGAKVSVYAGGNTYVRENLPVRGFLSCVDPSLHFGLGNIQVVDSMLIRWPDGSLETRGITQVNRKHKISQTTSAKEPLPVMNGQTFRAEVLTDIKHVENDFVDFRVQPLLPHMYSTAGPALAMADINGDGLNDVFLGGAKGYASKIFMMTKGGGYRAAVIQPDIAIDSEITDALFFDADGDADADLLVISGGYEFDPASPALADKLFLNDGNGKFKQAIFPDLRSSGACAKTADIDADGDLDLFIGSRIVPGNFPEVPESYILKNDGSGNFTIDDDIPQTLKTAGLVSDAVWTDLNADSYPDLIVVGKWMPVKVFINERGKLSDRSAEWLTEKTDGLWNCISAQDLDGDGDQDFVIGNFGRNSQMRASETQPVTLVYDDFDKNGSLDPIMNYFVQGKSYPYPTRDELTEQLPSFKKRFTDYKSYSTAQIEDVLTPEEMKHARKLSVVKLETVVAFNEKGKLKLTSLPTEAQMAPVLAVNFVDADGDSIKDVVTGGNLSAARARTGKVTGNFGFVFRNDGRGYFGFLPPSQTGIQVQGDVREILVDRSDVIFGINNGSVLKYTLARTSGVKVVKKSRSK